MFVEGGKTITKPDVFSLEGLVAWLEKMPADQKYDWSDAPSCLLGQWCASNGLQGHELRRMSLSLGKFRNPATEVFAQVALGDVRFCTFGAALTRAREALASRA